MIIDTHTHLYLRDEFGDDAAAAVGRAVSAGVGHMVFPNVDLSTADDMISLHRKFPDVTSLAMGLHPTEIGTGWKRDLARIYDYFERGRYVAVGEIGIDLYWDRTFRDEQIEALDIQLHWAEDKRLPAIIHCRNGLDEAVAAYRNYSGIMPESVFHSFTGGADDVRKLRTAGDFYFGLNGVVTFKNACEIREAVPEIGLDRILLETDSPYLAPVPYRGRRNESSYLPAVAAKIAEILCVDEELVAEKTTANAAAFFRLNL